MEHVLQYSILFTARPVAQNGWFLLRSNPHYD